jgi:probable rRNA maturation factor
VHIGRAGVRAPVGAANLVRLARMTLHSEGIRDALVSIAFISRRAIASLNRRHLDRRGSTDVIAFAMQRDGNAGPVLGDIYIAPEVASENARNLGIPVREEIARLVVHGTLHVLGYDHSEGDERTGSTMWKKQEAILSRAGAKRSRK